MSERDADAFALASGSSLEAFESLLDEQGLFDLLPDNPELFNEYLKRLRNELTGSALFRASANDADDVLQDLLLKLATTWPETLAKCRAQGKPVRAYAMGFVRYRSWQLRGRARGVDFDFGNVESKDDLFGDMEHASELDLLRAELRQCLTQDEVRLFELRELEHASYAGLAELFDVEPETLRKRMERIKDKLRARLRPRPAG